MSKKITINPITRIEGHMAVQLEVENNRVSKAYCQGEMFRGFETLLRGRSPLDAQQITQRICGVCPISHGVASCLAQEAAYGIYPPANGGLLRQMILGANFLQSHITHFYHLSLPDYLDITAVKNYKGKDIQLNNFKNWYANQYSSKCLFPAAPFLPRYEGKYISDLDDNLSALKSYLTAFEMRRLSHQAAAVFSGKMPHASALLPGGVSETVTAINISNFKSKFSKLKTFIEHAYIPDVLSTFKTFPDYFEIGRGCGNFMAYGVFLHPDVKEMLIPGGIVIGEKLLELDKNKIIEDIKFSFYSAGKRTPIFSSEFTPYPKKTDAYSWIKAPRYDKNVMEVGPLARIIVAYKSAKNAAVTNAVNRILKDLNIKIDRLNSVGGRHIARALECKLIVDHCLELVERLIPGQPTMADYSIPQTGQGVGLTEAPRGALGHWLTIEDRKIKNYQCVVPTTWNCSPRDDNEVPGTMETALVDTPVEDADNPLEATRVIRSFDPCLACSVH